MTISRRGSGKRPNGRLTIDRFRGPGSGSQCDPVATPLRLTSETGQFVARSELERFWGQVEMPPWWKPWGCARWVGYCNRDGYGVFTLADGTKVRAHRYAWLAVHGSELVSVAGHDCHDRSDCTAGRECPHRACVRVWEGRWWWPARWRRPHVIASTTTGNRRRVDERRRR